MNKNIRKTKLKGKKLIGTILQAVSLIIAILTIAIGFWVYAIDRYNPESGLYFDGFGRKLYKATAIFGSDLTPGLVWELIDTGIAIIVVGIVIVLFSFGTRLKK